MPIPRKSLLIPLGLLALLGGWHVSSVVQDRPLHSLSRAPLADGPSRVKASPHEPAVSSGTLNDAERQTIGEQIRQAERWFTAHEGQFGCAAGVTAPNPAQQVTVQADGEGFAINAWKSGATVRFSHAGSLASEAPQASGDQLSWKRGQSVEEWVKNGPHGPEHGFTLAVDDDPTAARRLSLAVDTSLTVHALADGSGLAFLDADGTAVLRYDHALAVDANQRPLPLKVQWAGNGRCDFVLDDRDAVYPVVIDPLISTPGVELPDDQAAGSPVWGTALAMDGGFLAVGSNVQDGTGLPQVYIFERQNDGRWTLETKVTPGDGLLAAGFGASLGMVSGRLVVGAPSYLPAGWQGSDRPGALYVFERQTDGTWPQVARITANDLSLSLALGASVSLGVDRVAAGTADRFPNAHEAAYVFARQPDGTWAEEARMQASDWVIGDGFGRDVSLYGSRLAVTAVDDAHDGFSLAGAVYLFERNGLSGAWDQVGKIVPDDAQAKAFFGSSVALGPNRLAVGANIETSPSYYTGAVYVFEKPLNGAWAQKAKIVPHDSADDDSFGRSVSLDNTSLLVGSSFGGQLDRGRAYLYDRGAGGTSWTLREQLEDFTPLHSTSFGFAVLLRGDVAVVGSFGDVQNSIDGRVHIFTRSKAEWGLARTIGDTPAENGVQRWTLGAALAMDGDFLLAGAPETANQSRGGANVGGAYLFERHKTKPNDWALRKVLIGADSAAGGRFGKAVGLSADKIVIGAPDAAGSGAAYLFLRDQGGPANWGQAKKWAGPAAGAKFGAAVAIDTEVAAVGSPGEDGQKGKVRIYQRDFGGVGTWGLIKTLDDPVAAAIADKFGYALCLDDDRLLVGSPGANAATVNGPVANGGRAYLFEKNLGGGYNFGQQDTMPQLLPAQGYAGREGGLFGTAVALDGDTALIGEPGEPGPAGGAGRAYIFERNTGGVDAWDQVKQVVPPVGQPTLSFGQAVALKRGIAAVADTLDQVCLYAQNSGGANVWANTGRLRDRQQGIDSEKFGAALAFDGTILAVGEPGALEYNGGGAIRIYEAKADGWVPLKQVTGGDTDQDDTLGAAVALRDGWLLVGAPGQGNLTGAAYFFRRNNGGAENWGSLLKIGAGDATTGDEFGSAVALDGRTAVVGAPKKAKVESVNGFPVFRTNAGAAYFFSRNQGGAESWGQVTKVVSTVTGSAAVNDYFGKAVAVDGPRIAVGMPADASDKGRAYLYALLGNGSWGLTANLQPATVVLGDLFGSAVAVSGEALAVGAPGQAVDNLGPNTGTVYVFERDAAGQYPQAGLVNAPIGSLIGGARFGSHLALEGDIGLIAAPTDSALATNAGAGFMLQRKADGLWAVTTQFRPLVSVAGGAFGSSVALQGTTAVFGASGTNGSTGAVHVFERWAAADWHLMQTLVSSDAEPLEMFGSAVAVDGHILAVGAQADDDAGVKAGSVSLFVLQGRPYDAWRRAWFGDAVVNDATKEATHWGDVADPDGDGIPNIEEAYAGTGPVTFNVRRETAFFREAGTGFFVARWQRDATIDRGIQARPQYSTDLKSWFTDGGDPDAPHQLEFHDIGGPALGTVEARLHAPDFPAAFIRLQLWRE